MSSTLPRRGKKPVEDIHGLCFGRLRVVSYEGIGKHGKHYWLCLCECGGDIVLPRGRINKPYGAKSCGCLTKEVLLENRQDPTKHGLHKHKLYAIYQGMKQRCYNPNSQRYKYYGSSGIAVCADWLSNFTNFYEWAIHNGWQEGLSIDRIDSAEDYCPENCEWVTVSENSRRMNVRKHRK